MAFCFCESLSSRGMRDFLHKCINADQAFAEDSLLRSEGQLL